MLRKSSYFSLSQASKDAARYPVAAKVAELLVRGIVSPVAFILFSDVLDFMFLFIYLFIIHVCSFFFNYYDGKSKFVMFHNGLHSITM